jgi:hypothetical protein
LERPVPALLRPEPILCGFGGKSSYDDEQADEDAFHSSSTL